MARSKRSCHFHQPRTLLPQSIAKEEDDACEHVRPDAGGRGPVVQKEPTNGENAAPHEEGRAPPCNHRLDLLRALTSDRLHGLLLAPGSVRAELGPGALLLELRRFLSRSEALHLGL